MKFPRVYSKGDIQITGKQILVQGKVLHRNVDLWWVHYYPPDNYFGIDNHHMIHMYDTTRCITYFHDTVEIYHRLHTIILDYIYIDDDKIYVEAICNTAIITLVATIMPDTLSEWRIYARGRLVVPLDGGHPFILYGRELSTNNKSFILNNTVRLDAYRLVNSTDAFLMSHKYGPIVVPVDVYGSVVHTNIDDQIVTINNDNGHQFVYIREYIITSINGDNGIISTPVIEVPLSMKTCQVYTEGGSMGISIVNGTATVITHMGTISRHLSNMTPTIFRLSFSYETGYYLYTNRRFSDNQLGFTIYQMTIDLEMELVEVLHIPCIVLDILRYRGLWLYRERIDLNTYRYTCGYNMTILYKQIADAPKIETAQVYPSLESCQSCNNILA